MSDLHRLPLVGHDLPEAAPPGPKARVIKLLQGWTWFHRCPHRPESWGALQYAQETAFHFAYEHMRKCR